MQWWARPRGQRLDAVPTPRLAMRPMLALVAGFGWLIVWGTALAGGLDRPEITDYRIWDSTRCYKPRPPVVQIVDPLSFNLAVEGFNQYLAHMRRYLECAQQEANEDFASLKRVLEQGLARARGEALEELQEARDEIEQYRSLYAQPPAGNAPRPSPP
jgi:hypothetical protein